MFRRFADRIGSLVHGESPDEVGMTALQSMGFDAEQARGALRATDGDVNRAAELLLANGDTTTASAAAQRPQQFPAPSTTNNWSDVDGDDGALQQALQESMQMEESRQFQNQTTKTVLQKQSTPAFNSTSSHEKGSVAKSATKKSTTTSKPPFRAKFHDKVVQEEVYRCCTELKSSPAAVDTLYRILTSVNNDPENEKFRKVNKTSTGFQRNVQHAPGAVDLLIAMKFVDGGSDTLTLERSQVDSNLILFGISVLDQVKDSFQYQEGKRRIQAKSAFSKFEHALLNHHPDVKVPAKLQDKSKEEQILRCGDRLKSYPAAVDTLYRALVAVQENPENGKFRTINKNTSGYQRSVEGAPGAEALLLAMNFRPKAPNLLVLESSQVDPALLFLGISSLEQAKTSAEYKEGKRKIRFAKEAQEIRFSGDSSEVEAVRRAEFISKCPTEPNEGRGALLQVQFSDVSIRRRFDGDDVLQDVLNWLGGHGSVIPDKILSREWCLVDLNRYPPMPMDCQGYLNKTLQHIGCWPSGKLEIQPSSDEWRLNGDVGGVKPGSSRGLGVAPMDTK